MHPHGKGYSNVALPWGARKNRVDGGESKEKGEGEGEGNRKTASIERTGRYILKNQYAIYELFEFPTSLFATWVKFKANEVAVCAAIWPHPHLAPPNKPNKFIYTTLSMCPIC